MLGYIRQSLKKLIFRRLLSKARAVVFSLICGGIFISCSAHIPILLNDARTPAKKKTPETMVDVFTVTAGNELERIIATPAEEHFKTVGLPSRPVNVWRFYPERAEESCLLPGDHPIFDLWAAEGGELLVAVCSDPRFKSPLKMQHRVATYPRDGRGYPIGTQTLILNLTDDGLLFTASTQEAQDILRKPEKEPQTRNFK